MQAVIALLPCCHIVHSGSMQLHVRVGIKRLCYDAGISLRFDLVGVDVVDQRSRTRSMLTPFRLHREPTDVALQPPCCDIVRIKMTECILLIYRVLLLHFRKILPSQGCKLNQHFVVHTSSQRHQLSILQRLLRLSLRLSWFICRITLRLRSSFTLACSSACAPQTFLSGHYSTKPHHWQQAQPQYRQKKLFFCYCYQKKPQQWSI